MDRFKIFIDSTTWSGGQLVQISSPRKRRTQSLTTRARTAPPAKLELCRGCNRHVMPHEVTCPLCGGDLKALAMTYQKKLKGGQKAYRRLMRLLQPN